MIHDAIERAVAVTEANFDADLAGLASSKGVALPWVSATVYPRSRPEIFAADRKMLPGIGIYSEGATTAARRDDRRESTVTIVWDLFARGPHPELLEHFCELAAEAILRCVDRMGGGAAFTLGAGEARDSVLVTIARGTPGEGQKHYDERVRVIVPVNEEDQGLS